MTIERLGVIGGGAWGTALAQVAASGGRDILLWALEQEVVDGINQRRENSLYLSGVALAGSIRATPELAALDGCDALLIVTPAQHMRAVLAQLPDSGTPLILCSKGIEESSGELLHTVAKSLRPKAPVAVLSGPTFAREVAEGLPTAVTLACEDDALAIKLRDRLARPAFRVYVTDDVCGAEIGGAVKNVLAIACGVVEGRGLGQNGRAALIARGFAEMTRFGLTCGARRETLTGLSGLGDLVLTCSSTQSRNFSLGVGIGQGKSPKELLAERRTVAEGAFTAPVLRRIADERGIDMPIVAAVADLIEGTATLDTVLEKLLTRPPRTEAA